MLESTDGVILEKTFSSIIRKSLGEKPLQVIKKRLAEKYGISLHQAVNQHYEKLSDILKENFAEGGATNIEKQFLAAIISSQKQTTNESKEKVISDPALVKQIMEDLGDADMMSVINNVMKKPKLVLEILKSCKLPQTSGYRKINKLADNGLLVVSGYDTGSDGRKVFKYTTSFDSITVFMENGKAKINIKPKKVGKNQYISIPFLKK